MTKYIDRFEVVNDQLSDQTDSIEIYMKQLNRFPILTKNQEIRLARIIRRNKIRLLEYCLEHKGSIRRIKKIQKWKLSNLKKIFVMLSVDADEIQLLKADLHLKLGQLEKTNIPPRGIKRILKQLVVSDEILASWVSPIKICRNKELRQKVQVAEDAIKEAKNRLIECNLRLVFARAKRYLDRGLAIEDLLQEGNLGLLRAVERFDHTKGYKFSTYATWWIEQAFGRAISNKAKVIRVPVHMVDDINKVNKITRELRNEFGREPEIDEIADRLAISEEKIGTIKDVANLNTTYLDSPTAGEGNDTALNLLVDEDSETPLERLEKEELYYQVRAVLAQLTPQEEKFIRLRFGIGERKINNLKYIAPKCGFAQNNIRSIEDKIQEKIRRFWEDKK